jgi:hypothetical protein
MVHPQNFVMEAPRLPAACGILSEHVLRTKSKHSQHAHAVSGYKGVENSHIIDDYAGRSNGVVRSSFYCKDSEDSSYNLRFLLSNLNFSTGLLF